MRWLVVAIVALWSPLACAHSNINIGSFYLGGLDLILNWEQALFMVVAGLWCAQQQPSSEQVTLGAVIVCALTAGTITVFLGYAFSDPRLLSAIGYTAVGLAVAGRIQSRQRWPLVVAVIAAFTGGLGYGGSEADGIAHRYLFATGMTVGAALLLFYLTYALTRLPRQGWPEVALRVLGSWIAAIGLMVAAFVLTRIA